MRCIVAVLFSLFTFLPGVAQNIKGVYVDLIPSIAGNTAAENSLLRCALCNSGAEPVSGQYSASSLTRISRSTLPTGFYILRVADNSSGEVYTHKILFTHE